MTKIKCKIGLCLYNKMTGICQRDEMEVEQSGYHPEYFLCCS